MLAALAISGLSAGMSPAAAAQRKDSTVVGFDLPRQIEPRTLVRDTFRVPGPRRRVVLQHRAPGERWSAVARARTSTKRTALVRVRVVPRGSEWVWKARLKSKPWRAVARTSGRVHDFRIKAPPTKTRDKARSKVERIEVTSRDGTGYGLPAATVCDDAGVLAGPRSRPTGAVVVNPGQSIVGRMAGRPAGTTYYLTKGVHTLGNGEYEQIVPRNRDSFIGAPGAVLDGRGVNRYAFGQQARGVTIEHLTVTGFLAAHNEGVVNHDAGKNWTVRNTTIEANGGAGLMIGDGSLVEDNCLRDNGQYGFNAYEPDGVVDVTLRGNEITGNNTDDWETRRPGCGCTGGGKFWNTTGAKIIDNYIHHNLSVGLWADGVNSDFLIKGNLIAVNDAEGIMYEQSYNATITKNTLVGNATVKGPTNPGFPAAAIYISEAGGDRRAPGGQSALRISRNTLRHNWSGIILWENADRFAGSPADTSGAMTSVNPDITLDDCVDPDLVSTEPYYTDCRWNTQNVRVADNRFVFARSRVGGTCRPDTGCGYNGVFSNYGTYPQWSPYQGTAVSERITFNNANSFARNSYVGPWRFVAYDQGTLLTWRQWRSQPYGQDAGSTRR
jgi:hypothetical protein